MGINLALGVLYTWSVVSKGIPESWGWTETVKSLPYSIACMIFALVMVPAGRAQDRFGPRWVALAGGLATGLGMILAGFTTSVVGFVVGFGVLAGTGIGLGYAAATPAAVKWFPPQRTGLVAGLVVAGFGLASVYISPLAKYLIGAYGIQNTMVIFGIAFLVVVSVLSQFLRVPPAGYKPPAPASAASAKARPPAKDYTWPEMLRTPQFYLMWIMYAFAAGAGLMIIAKLSTIVKVQGALETGFLFVALLAVGNAGGRVLAGVVSDRIGRSTTMAIVFVFQAVLMFVLPQVTQLAGFIAISILLGANYGANLTLFPAATKDFFGLKNFGVNYGWVFTAWGVGGLVLPMISGRVYDASLAASRAALTASGGDPAKAAGSFTTAYMIAGGTLLAAAAISFVLRPPARRAETDRPADDSKPAEPVAAAR
jgi:OFA family oxalate/formate antiporter-like MFS transporter